MKSLALNKSKKSCKKVFTKVEGNDIIRKKHSLLKEGGLHMEKTKNTIEKLIISKEDFKNYFKKRKIISKKEYLDYLNKKGVGEKIPDFFPI